MNVVTVFSHPFLYTKDRAQEYQYKKKTVCHHRVGCARLSDGGDVARKVEVAGKNRKETAISLLSPCAFRLNLNPWGRG